MLGRRRLSTSEVGTGRELVAPVSWRPGKSQRPQLATSSSCASGRAAFLQDRRFGHARRTRRQGLSAGPCRSRDERALRGRRGACAWTELESSRERRAAALPRRSGSDPKDAACARQNLEWSVHARGKRSPENVRHCQMASPLSPASAAPADPPACSLAHTCSQGQELTHIVRLTSSSWAREPGNPAHARPPPPLQQKSPPASGPESPSLCLLDRPASARPNACKDTASTTSSTWTLATFSTTPRSTSCPARPLRLLLQRP